MQILKLNGHNLTLENIEEVARHFRLVELSDEAVKNVERSRQIVNKKTQEDKLCYSINTGFGDLCDVRIEPKDLQQLQVNLLRSHAVGVVDALPEEVIRALMIIRINTLVQGNSGVRLELVQLLIDFLKSSKITNIFIKVLYVSKTLL